MSDQYRFGFIAAALTLLEADTPLGGTTAQSAFVLTVA
jgi:hypothetical protein